MIRSSLCNGRFCFLLILFLGNDGKYVSLRPIHILENNMTYCLGNSFFISIFSNDQFEASTLISEGYFSALVKDHRHLPRYWEGILEDFPRHPIKEKDPTMQHSLGCTLYGSLVSTPLSPNPVVFMLYSSVGFINVHKGYKLDFWSSKVMKLMLTA